MPENLHGGLTGKRHTFLRASNEKSQLKKPESQVETTMWVLLALLTAFVVWFGYLFWNKF
jgi:hypothetical protein